MANEVELKFELAEEGLQALENLPWYRKAAGARSATFVSVYFDTPKLKLWRRGISLRVRHDVFRPASETLRQRRLAD